MAVRKPPIHRLPSERVTTVLEEVRMKAKGATSPDVLEEIYTKYNYDEVVCENLAINKATPSIVREKLAGHESLKIRYFIAERSQYLKDEHVLKELTKDECIIRAAVAKRTENDSILELLFRSNPSNEGIRQMCIKRLTDMNKLEKLIFKREPEKTLNIYLNSIMSNRHLNRRIVLLVWKYAKELSDEQICLIAETIENDRKSTGEMLDKITME